MPAKSSIWDRVLRAFGINSSETEKTRVVPDEPTHKDIKGLPKSENTKPALPPPPSKIEAKNEPSRIPERTIINSPPVDLVLGIDLGTSCTKAVIGDPAWKDRSYPVRFSEGSNIGAFLQPTRFGEEANLKMRLMDHPHCQHVRDAMACCLAKVIHKACHDFITKGPADYRNRELRWSLNIGFPRERFTAENQDLSKAYREIARIAIALCSQPDRCSLELARSIMDIGNFNENFIPDSRINFYPEIAAQLGGYITSPHCQHGPLLLVDVGAGTLDISTIILHNNQDSEVVSFHCCTVQELGVLRLYERRIQALKQIAGLRTFQPLERYQDGMTPIPECLNDMGFGTTPELDHAFENASQDFKIEVLSHSLSTLMRFRERQRNANNQAGFEPWGRNLRFFLTGGGSRSRFFKDCLARDLEQRLATYTTCWEPNADRRRNLRQGFLIDSLPFPSDSRFRGFPRELEQDFDRMSVAYGLAFGGQNLMRITSSG